MNLLEEGWMPFRLREGKRVCLPLNQIVREDILDFALPRADFQGAAYQLLIGILQTSFAPATAEIWQNYLMSPPTSQQLTQAFAEIRHAFNLFGDGPRWMQDLDPLTEQKATTVSHLLIEAPGANAIQKNSDHFVKRETGQVMSVAMAAMALFTLQINAPSGGQGHRVGLRGGGPLTSLIMPVDGQDHTRPTYPQREVTRYIRSPYFNAGPHSLWQKIWLNILHREYWHYSQPNFHDGSVFPWLAATPTSEQGAVSIHPQHVHPLHMYWAMPRRIRLLAEKDTADCQLSGVACHTVIKHIKMKNYGIDYQGDWSRPPHQHPFTPFQKSKVLKTNMPYALKGSSQGVSYQTWATLAFGGEEQQCAAVVAQYRALCQQANQFKQGHDGSQPVQFGLWVFGYDMDNMQARGWYHKYFPIYFLAAYYNKRLQKKVRAMLRLCHDVVESMRQHAQFTPKPFAPKQYAQKQQAVQHPRNKQNITPLVHAFWQQTEQQFFVIVEQFVADLAANRGQQFDPVKAWAEYVLPLSQQLFSYYLPPSLSTPAGRSSDQAQQRFTTWLAQYRTQELEYT